MPLCVNLWVIVFQNGKSTLQLCRNRNLSWSFRRWLLRKCAGQECGSETNAKNQFHRVKAQAVEGSL
jgi:hypothetical protein